MMSGSSEIDKVSGLSLEFLNAAVFCFFPNSTWGYLSLDGGASNTQVKSHPRVFYTGSIQEHLDLPILTNKHTDEKHQTDFDRMVIANSPHYLFGLDVYIQDLVYFMSQRKEHIRVIQDKQHPSHCYLQVSADRKFHGIQEKYPRLLRESNCQHFLCGEAVSQYFKLQCLFDNKATNNTVCVSYTNIGAYNYDDVLCLEVKCPDCVSQKLTLRGKVARDTCLPKLKKVVESLQEEYIHVVYKPHKHSSNSEIQWRFSFSLSERKLARSLNDIQRTAYRVLKGLVLKINDEAKDDIKLFSYLLKTVLFWVCEGVPKGFCVPRNIGKFFLALLDKLICFLQHNFVPHYFIPEGNLLDMYKIDIVEKWTKRLQEIRSRPFKAMINFWETYELKGYYYATYFQMFSEWRHTKELMDLTMYYHIKNLNIVDYIRLSNFRNPVFCSCSNKWITDFFQGCQKCLIADFCDGIRQPISAIDAAILSKLALMWYSRSLQDKNNKKYEEKALEYFHQAGYQIKQGSNIEGTQMYFIHFALYWQAKKKYEETVYNIIQALIINDKETTPAYVYLPCFFSVLLDELLQIKLCGKPDLQTCRTDLAYHILSSCYSQAGVYTELILPPNVKDKYYTDEFLNSLSPDELGSWLLDLRNLTFYDSATYVGDLMFLSKQYYQAAEWYITQPNRGYVPEILIGFKACIAKLFNPKSLDHTVKTYLRLK